MSIKKRNSLNFCDRPVFNFSEKNCLIKVKDGPLTFGRSLFVKKVLAKLTRFPYLWLNFFAFHFPSLWEMGRRLASLPTACFARKQQGNGRK